MFRVVRLTTAREEEKGRPKEMLLSWLLETNDEDMDYSQLKELAQERARWCWLKKKNCWSGRTPVMWTRLSKQRPRWDPRPMSPRPRRDRDVQNPRRSRDETLQLPRSWPRPWSSQNSRESRELQRLAETFFHDVCLNTLTMKKIIRIN